MQADDKAIHRSLRKMHTELTEPVSYRLPIGGQLLPLNSLIGQSIQLTYQGAIHCIYCGRASRKSFNQGYCYPCFQRLARCDSCIIHPERCHYFAGTCREPAWGEQHCLQDHIVYLANTSGLKVGITRASQLPTRWLDQGATQALPIMRVRHRLQSGLVEVALKRHVNDKTYWQAMLKGEPESLDLRAERDQLLANCASDINALQDRFGVQAIQVIDDAEVVTIHYPVKCYPTKVRALNFDKQPVVAGVLQGIKGQYLLLDSGVINIRKFAGYVVDFACSSVDSV